MLNCVWPRMSEPKNEWTQTNELGAVCETSAQVLLKLFSSFGFNCECVCELSDVLCCVELKVLMCCVELSVEVLMNLMIFEELKELWMK